MAADGYMMFNGANTEDLYFGDMSVDYVYYGNVLVWAKIKNLFKDGYYNTTDKLFEFTPSTDITLDSVSTLGEHYNTGCILRILNEVGLCVAYQNGNGAQSDVTIYNKTGVLKTWTSLGTITLYAGNKYYISMRGSNDGMYVPQYVGLTGNYKTFSNIQNVNSVYSGAANHRCSGEASTFDEITRKPVNTYFVWRGSPMTNSMLPNQSGVDSPYPYLMKRNMSRVKRVFVDADFTNVPLGSYNDDMARYAYIYRVMGNTPGDEFAMNTNHWNQGFNIGGTQIFNDNKTKIYTLSSQMSLNRITSMNPITEEPPLSTRVQWEIYYKAAVQWSSGPSERAVVVWDGNSWIYAQNWGAEWSADGTYDITNYIDTIYSNEAKDFNKVSVQSGDKYFARINGSDI